MASRTTDTSDNEFDLAGLLWGTAVSGPDPTGNRGEQPLTGQQLVCRQSMAEADDHRNEQKSAIRENPNEWDLVAAGVPEVAADLVALGQANAGRGDDEAAALTSTSDDETLDPDLDVDLDWSADSAELLELGLDEDADDDAEFVPDHLRLSYGELTQRLHKVVLPRLTKIAGNGYLTVGYLAQAVVELQQSDSHLAEVRRMVDQSNVPVLPSRSHRGVRQLPVWAIRDARRRFSDLVSEDVPVGIVLDRFGYADVDLSEGTRDYLVRAWLCHCLSRAEERELAEVVAAEVACVGVAPSGWSTTALAAREALVLDNLWLVARMARKHIGSGIAIDDLLQAGTLGAIRAADKFDPGLGYRFVTYAGGWVFQSIMRHVAEHSRLIRLPVHAHERGNDVDRVSDLLENELGRPPRVAEVAEAAGVPEGLARGILVTTRPVSIESAWARRRLRRADGDSAFTDEVEARALAESVKVALSRLSERERAVVELRFGLRDDTPRTLEEVGRQFGVTRERIRQIEAKAIERLRHPACTRLLGDFAPDTRCRTMPSRKTHMLVASDVVQSMLTGFTLADQEIVWHLRDLDGQAQCSEVVTARQLQDSPATVRSILDRAAGSGERRDQRPEVGPDRPPGVRTPPGDTRPSPTSTVSHGHRSTDASPHDLYAILSGHAERQPSDHEAAPPVAGCADGHAIWPVPSGGERGLRGSVARPAAADPSAIAINPLSDGTREALTEAAQSISDHALHAVAEARLGGNGREGLTREQTARRMGVTPAYVRLAEQGLLDAAGQGTAQMLARYWTAAESPANRAPLRAVDCPRPGLDDHSRLTPAHDAVLQAELRDVRDHLRSTRPDALD